MRSRVSIRNFTRRPLASRIPYASVASTILPAWEISLVFVGPVTARTLNKKLRKKTYVPNVLSYVVGDKSGEIIICPSEAAKQAPNYQLSVSHFLLLLFIHGLLHLKGGAHSVTMERSERRLLAQFVKSRVRVLPNATTHSNRNRYRHVPGKNGRGGRNR